MKFVSKEAQNSTSLPPVLSSQAAFSWRHSVQEIHQPRSQALSFASLVEEREPGNEVGDPWLQTSLLTTTLGYSCSWAVLFRAKRAPNTENDSSEDSEVDNRLEKIHFADLVKDAKSGCRFFCFPPISSWTEWCHKNTAWLTRTVSKWRHPKSNFRLHSRLISSG